MQEKRIFVRKIIKSIVIQVIFTAVLACCAGVLCAVLFDNSGNILFSSRVFWNTYFIFLGFGVVLIGFQLAREYKIKSARRNTVSIKKL